MPSPGGTRPKHGLRQFVGDASHELRTPVTTIRGYAELYRAGGLADPEELGEAMRRTELEAERMGRLVEDLLALARLDQDRPLDRSPVDLTAVAADAARDAKAVDPDRPVEAHVDTPVTVVGDDARIRQVVANLVGNALVHTPRGTPIELRVSQRDGRRRARGRRPRARAWPPMSRPACSSASTAPTRPGPAIAAAPDSASPSSTPPLRPTAAPSRCTPLRAKARPSASSCRSADPRDTAGQGQAARPCFQ